MRGKARVDPPVVLATVDELLVFDDVVSAEQYVEAEDVENDEYCAAFDAKGMKLRFQIGTRRPISWIPVSAKTIVIVAEGEVADSAELRSLLLSRLPAYGVTTNELEGGTLVALLDFARRVARQS
jgi:hypothetical protein